MIEDRDIPRALVEDYAAHMARTHGVTIARRPAWLDAAQRAIGIDPTRYATTIGRSIYLPMDPGDTSLGWSPWEQVSTLAHECEHAVQSDGRELAYAADYLLHPERRTAIECRAFAAQLDLELWRRGSVGSWWPHVRAAALRSYHVSPTDLVVAERHLAVLVPTARAGGVVSSAGLTAMRWLDEHAPDLRAPGVPSRRPS